ncbi:hypothetical protein F4861DRAFT_545453 [Xylaria intraflava]|nr:hypothetical protein F4861DRAFT_545453 [Xylaria intraflava]
MSICVGTAFSSPQGRRKSIRKLYTKLRHCQADDVPIPNPTVMEIKFLLKTHGRCYKIFVESNDAPSKPPPLVSVEDLPRFIYSQLEAQRIADDDTQSAQLSTVLGILLRRLVVNPVRSNSVPTLFFWHDSGRQRTFCLFAYLTRKMDSRTYSVAELLSLRRSRTSEMSHGLPAKLKEDPELDEVVSKGNGTQAQARASRKQKDVPSSSYESDEVYTGKGHPRRSVKPSSNTQWRYRGRTGSEVTSNEPLPAPITLDKQSSEGFQKFFKAVVSPTHVRVTAGGRIVPNTRGSASPTTKWDKERAAPDAQQVAEPSNGTKAGSAYTPAVNQVSAPVVPAVYPSHPMIYQQMGMPIPVYQPVHTSVQPLAYPCVSPLPPQVTNQPYLAFSGAAQGIGAMGNHNEQRGGENNNNSGRVPIRLSPPDQFDHSRPFYMNGQLMFPNAAMVHGQMAPMMANQYVPAGAMASHAYPGQRMAAANQSASNIPMAVNNMSMAGNNAPMAANNMPSTGLNGHVPSSNLNSQQVVPPTLAPLETEPPLSSIRPSEITRRQIAGLRESLKFYTSQLQFNRHQIDEDWALEQARKLQYYIDLFEQNMNRQFQRELLLYPDMDPTSSQTANTAAPMNTPSRPPSIRHTQASGSSHHSSIRSIAPARAPKPFQPQFQHQAGRGFRGGNRPNRAVVGINSTRTDNSTAHIDALEEAVIKKFSAPDATPEQKKMLAAIIRPLNPKYDPKPSTDQQFASDNTSPKESNAQSGSDGNKSVPAKMQPSGSYLQNQRTFGHTAQSGGASLSNANVPPYTGLSSRNGATLPYLVGSYPPGADPWTFSESNFIYARELTEPEKQARRLYWGRVTNTGMGLPKFDGKDFYPPSPERTCEKKSGINSAPTGRPGVDIGFDSRRSGVDPFRSSRDGDSVRSHESGRKFSKAIPIVAPPPDMDKKTVSNASTTSKVQPNESGKDINRLGDSLQGCILSPSDEASAKNMEKKKSPSLNRRAGERSSAKSGHDLWQTMLKKGSTSGSALPSAVSSTTATGYLPQFAGNAIASLGPTISNGSPARVSLQPDDKLVGLEGARPATEKVGENCPPSSAPSTEHDITKDLHERMLRDAERRGVIGSDWQ